MGKKYAVTYKLGETTVHIVAPPPMKEEEKEIILRQFHFAAWTAWNSLPVDERLKLNLGVDLTAILQHRLTTLFKAE